MPTTDHLADRTATAPRPWFTMAFEKVRWAAAWVGLMLVSCITDESNLRDGRVIDAGPSDANLQTCLSGAAFIDCPGAKNPALYCSNDSCKWISTGNALKPFLSWTDNSCSCTGSSCPMETLIYRFVHERGFEPWTREKDLNVTLTINPDLAIAQDAVSCTGCNTGCSAGDNPCTGSNVGVLQRDLPGTYRVLIWTNGGLYGWMLELEMDLGFSGGPRARACRLPISDALSCTAGDTPRCAISGSIELGGEPSAQLLNVAGKFDLIFADGLKIKGEFTNHR
jgi:hypothetical protein